MAGKKPTEPSAESIARSNRQRIAQEEGARAMEDVARDAVAVRKNMDRLRALRLAKEAEQALLAPAETAAPPKKKRQHNPSKDKLAGADPAKAKPASVKPAKAKLAT